MHIGINPTYIEINQRIVNGIERIGNISQESERAIGHAAFPLTIIIPDQSIYYNVYIPHLALKNIHATGG